MQIHRNSSECVGEGCLISTLRAATQFLLERVPLEGAVGHVHVVRNAVLLHLPSSSSEGRWQGSGYCYPMCHQCLVCLDSESHPELRLGALRR